MSTVYIKIDGYWFDVTSFSDHPGGMAILRKYHLRDATKAFNDVNHVDGVRMLEQFEVIDESLIQKLNEEEMKKNATNS
jgi:cytochrome b involved in lipid metabolism